MNNKISKTYIITDSHFFHKRIITDFGFRPPNFDHLIIKRWQDTVQPQDIVYHLGDVTWGSQGQLSTIMEGLPGTKILIRGNHDKNHSNNWFMDAGFAAVLEKAQVSKVILSHTPAIMTQAELDYRIINVHGHFHNNNAKQWEVHLTERITTSHYLLSLKNVNYYPVLLSDILKERYVENSKKLLENSKKNLESES